jgi:hypothetical protein
LQAQLVTETLLAVVSQVWQLVPDPEHVLQGYKHYWQVGVLLSQYPGLHKHLGEEVNDLLATSPHVVQLFVFVTQFPHL